MDCEATAHIVIGCSLEIHRRLGPGLFESVYEEVLVHELRKRGHRVERQKVIGIQYDDLKLDRAFCVDLIVNGHLLVELKSIEKLGPVHYKQLLTYLKLTGLPLGLLINFNHDTLKEGLRRVVNDHPPLISVHRAHRAIV